ncbi:MAG: hypothetical protein D6772_10185, partial [Bacteroidetes bacterium]
MLKRVLSLSSLFFLLLINESLLGQCAFEDLFGPIGIRQEPNFNELPVSLPDQDSRSTDNCESPSSGIDPGEYLDIQTSGRLIEAFSFGAASIEWFVGGNPAGTNSGNRARLNGYTGVAQLADQISNPANCDPAVAPQRNIPNEDIRLQCLDCPVIPADVPAQALNGGLDSTYFANPNFFSFSNYPSNGSDPLGTAITPTERDAWHFLYNVSSTTISDIHRGNRIPIYPSQEIIEPDDPIGGTKLQVNLRNFVFNAPGWFDNYLGCSIINSNSTQSEVLWSTYFPASNEVDFILPINSLEPSFPGDYSIQFWTTFDWAGTFSCFNYNRWHGHYIAFEMDIRRYSPPPPPANDDCVDAQEVTPQSGPTCDNYLSGTFSLANSSPPEMVLDDCLDDEDVWYRFVATSTQYDFTTRLVSGTGRYVVQLLSGVDCGNFSSVFCEEINDLASFRLVDLQPGTTYYLRFVQDLLNPTALDFEFCLRDRATSCRLPEVSVVEQCLHNEAYQLLVTVSDLSGNSSLELRDITQADPLPPLSITTPGTYAYGPIPAGVNFTLLVAADETDCDLIFGDFLPDCSQSPPPNDACTG